jgi:hypothetical protein
MWKPRWPLALRTVVEGVISPAGRCTHGCCTDDRRWQGCWSRRRTVWWLFALKWMCRQISDTISCQVLDIAWLGYYSMARSNITEILSYFSVLHCSACEFTYKPTRRHINSTSLDWWDRPSHRSSTSKCWKLTKYTRTMTHWTLNSHSSFCRREEEF